MTAVCQRKEIFYSNFIFLYIYIYIKLPQLALSLEQVHLLGVTFFRSEKGQECRQINTRQTTAIDMSGQGL